MLYLVQGAGTHAPGAIATVHMQRVVLLQSTSFWFVPQTLKVHVFVVLSHPHRASALHAAVVGYAQTFLVHSLLLTHRQPATAEHAAEPALVCPSHVRGWQFGVVLEL